MLIHPRRKQWGILERRKDEDTLMKKVLRASALSICLGLVAATAWLVATPIKAYAAICAADCNDGSRVACTGNEYCEARDGRGCSGDGSGSRRCRTVT
jgi:uncharacterized membrane protein